MWGMMMSWYRRWRKPGGIYFFTCVTYHRNRLLTSATARPLLRSAIEQTQTERPFDILAFVLLPDHMHALWQLPPGDDQYSVRWRLIKARFTHSLLAAGYEEPSQSVSRASRSERAVWQRRSWEHCIRDESDWKRHVDYIHWNPIKHRLVPAPRLWRYSTFMKYVRLSEYEEHWGDQMPATLQNWSPPGGFIE